MEPGEIVLSLSSYPSTGAVALVNGIRYHSSWLLFLVFAIAFLVNSILLGEVLEKKSECVRLGPEGKPLPPSKQETEECIRRQKALDFDTPRKIIFLCLSIGVIVTFIANGAIIISYALSRQDGWWCGKSTGIYICASTFFYCVILLSLIDSSPSPNIAHQITWVVATIIEVVLFSLSVSIYNSTHKHVNSSIENNQEIIKLQTNWNTIELIFYGIRVVFLILQVGLYILFSLERRIKLQKKDRTHIEEYSPLLGIGSINGTLHTDENNITPQHRDTEGTISSSRHVEEPAFYKPQKIPERNWWEYVRGYALFFPYIWPSKSFRLQATVVVCFLLLLGQRVVNIIVPLQIGKVTDHLTNRGHESSLTVPWSSILFMILFKFLQGSSGLLGTLRQILWIPIAQYSYGALTTASFEHVHGLSLDFHISKRTGEVISALNKGGSINVFLENITFQVFPMVFDLCVGIFYFGIAFDAYYAIIVSILTFTYMYVTIRAASWRSNQRRKMTNLSREEDAVKTDSLMSYETVKYFNAEVFEFNRYRQAVCDVQKMEVSVFLSMNLLVVAQYVIFLAGLLVTSIIAAYQVTTRVRQVGDFVTLLTYMSQLQGPLNYFGSFYRGMQNSMINSERLLDLFKQTPTVVDEPKATKLPSCEGHIRFENVSFSYDERKPALNGLTFDCPPGTTTALVGESGGGKSTVFRLLFRFYNAESGSIEVDGVNVKNIRIESLRSHIGVVPQDTILFNETLMYNLRYANQNATDDEIYNACRAASIHDKILAFPDGYNTRVGERGLRLSGGEKQRVAIARAIIKNPKIILLDEATAALDSETEQNIQESLKALSKGRTMLVIAHRLSTITTADQILVLHAGKVVEVGNHPELLSLKGRYYNMWKKQIRAEQAMEQATIAMAKAHALAAARDQRPGSSGNEGSPSEEASENDAGDKRSGATLVDNHNETRLQDEDILHVSDNTTINSETDDRGFMKTNQVNVAPETAHTRSDDSTEDESSDP
ncbi:ABC transporter aclQ [Erysiphe neolycopersici]|uniref:ABC transporter aclQ n=1 Tax=Erysiphe neolycopersici TaxID=212602 RepID=A0A420HX67_9PEZI|nr:ABC transporter aclQ [Erysiphe neolycopersici]